VEVLCLSDSRWIVEDYNPLRLETRPDHHVVGAAQTPLQLSALEQ
jgi:hypothetical protein